MSVSRGVGSKVLVAVCSLVLLIASCANVSDSVAPNPHDPQAAAARATASPFPVGGVAATSFVTMDMSKMSNAEQVAAAALQGLLAKTSPNQLFILNSASAPDAGLLWLQQTGLPHTACGCESGNVGADAFWAWLATMDTVSKNYVLYNLANNQDSVNSATSLAGVCSAIPVDSSVQSLANSAGFSQSQDASNLSVSDLISQFGTGGSGGCATPLATNVAFELSSSPTTGVFGGGPRDFAVLNNAIVFYDDGDVETNLNLVIGYVVPPSPIIGWGNPYSTESPFISPTGQAGDFYVAGDWARNLSALSGLAAMTTVVKAKPATPKGAVPGKTKAKANPVSATFLISDGDNLQWLLNRGDSVPWWGSGVRGTVPIGWTTSPALTYLAPTAWNYYATTATSNDEFVVGPSGIGYVFGNVTSNGTAFNAQLADLNTFAGQANIHTVGVFGNGDGWNNTEYLSGFLNQSNIGGAFYFEFSGWIPAEAGYNTQWFNNKPMIPTNEYLTDTNSVGTVGGDLCAGSKNNGIYAIYVNAWGNNNEPMSLITQVQQYVQNKCAGSVDFVPPSQLVTNAVSARAATPTSSGPPTPTVSSTVKPSRSPAR